MRRMVVAALALAALVPIGCGDDDEEPAGEARAPTAYFGWVLGTEQPTGVAFDVVADKDGTKSVTAYVCDGLGPPKGKAVWFKGDVATGTTNDRGQAVSIESASGRETIDVDRFDDQLVKGSFTDAAGDRQQYVAYPAHAGAGIYEVTLDDKLHYSGTSTDGSKLDAQASRDGLVKGTLTPSGGDGIPFTIHTLALASAADLSSRGLSADYKKDVRNSLVPGEYVAVVAPGGSHWLGRAGNVRRGSPGAAIIGLDKKD